MGKLCKNTHESFFMGLLPEVLLKRRPPQKKNIWAATPKKEYGKLISLTRFKSTGKCNLHKPPKNVMVLLGQAPLSTSIEVYKVVFDMNTFNSRSQKPTLLLTNSKSVCKLHGRRFKRRRTGKGLCRRYQNRQGKVAFCGTKRLKRSQTQSCDC